MQQSIKQTLLLLAYHASASATLSQNTNLISSCFNTSGAIFIKVMHKCKKKQHNLILESIPMLLVSVMYFLKISLLILFGILNFLLCFFLGGSCNVFELVITIFIFYL
jgi:hypothetical protein